MFNEAFRILKPGGSLVMQVPWQWRVHEAPYDFFRYTPDGLRLLLERSGFTEINVQSQTGVFTTIILKRNSFSLRVVRGPKLIRYPVLGLFSAFWCLGQKGASLLNKLERNWALETPGYFVTANKAGDICG